MHGAWFQLCILGNGCCPPSLREKCVHARTRNTEYFGQLPKKCKQRYKGRLESAGLGQDPYNIVLKSGLRSQTSSQISPGVMIRSDAVHGIYP